MQYREAFLVGFVATALGSWALYACGSSGPAAKAPAQGEVATSPWAGALAARPELPHA